MLLVELSNTFEEPFSLTFICKEALPNVGNEQCVSRCNRTRPAELGPPHCAQPGRPRLCQACHLTSDPVLLQSGALWIKPLAESTDTNRAVF